MATSLLVLAILLLSSFFATIILAADFSRIGRTSLADYEGTSFGSSALSDSKSSTAYLGTTEIPARISKISTKNYQQSDALQLGDSDGIISNLLLDDANTMLFAVQRTAPGRIVRVNVDKALSRNGHVSFAGSGEDDAVCSFMTPDSHIYVATGTRAIVKVRNNKGSLSRVDSLTLAEGEIVAACAASSNTQAYVVTASNKIISIDLDKMNSGAKKTISSGSYGSGFKTVIIVDGQLFLGGTQSIIRVSVSGGSVASSSISAVENLEFYEFGFRSVQEASGRLYFVSSFHPGRVVQVDPAAMERLSSLELNDGESTVDGATSFLVDNGTLALALAGGDLVRVRPGSPIPKGGNKERTCASDYETVIALSMMSAFSWGLLMVAIVVCVMYALQRRGMSRKWCCYENGCCGECCSEAHCQDCCHVNEAPPPEVQSKDDDASATDESSPPKKSRNGGKDSSASFSTPAAKQSANPLGYDEEDDALEEEEIN